MNEKLHKKKYGLVPHDPTGQTLQAEKYLADLFEEKGVVRGLNQFGGDISKGEYARVVLAELERMP